MYFSMVFFPAIALHWIFIGRSEESMFASISRLIDQLLEKTMLGAFFGFMTQGLLLVSGLIAFRSSGNVRKQLLFSLLGLACLLAVLSW
jgi:hypothetical protein